MLRFPAALCRAQLDDEGLQGAPAAPVDRSDAPGTWRGVANARRGAVFEEELAAPDRIAFLDVEPRAQAGVIISQQRHPPDLGAVVYALFGSPGDREVEALLDAVYAQLLPGMASALDFDAPDYPPNSHH